jgi:hypothetical protein
MPNVTFKTKDEIPEGLREHAKEEGGAFVVDLSPTVKLSEFRDKNITLMKEKDALVPKAEAYDKLTGGKAAAEFEAEIAELRSTAQLVKDGKLKTSDEIELAVKNRTAEQVKSLNDQIQEKAALAAKEKARADALDNEIKRSIIDREVTTAVLAGDSGVNPELLRFVLSDAYSVFEVTPERQLVAKKDGAIWYGADGASSISPKEWLGKVLEATPSLAKPSAGGGATGGDRGSKAMGGMTAEAFNKLPPGERRAIARKAQG